MNRKNLLIIIPAYNEERNITSLLDDLAQPEIAGIADVLVMNDASSDGTDIVVKERNYTLITHVFNLGYGSALQLGYKYAVRNGYEYVIQMDADGQHDPCNIPVLYQCLLHKDADGNCPDIVLGSRFMQGSIVNYRQSFLKKIAYSFFRWILKLGTGRNIRDITTGLQGLSKRAFLYYSKYNHFDDKYPDANMIMQSLLLGFRVEEVPAVMHARKNGASMHSGLKPVAYVFRMFLSMMAVIWRSKALKMSMVNELDK